MIAVMVIMTFNNGLLITMETGVQLKKLTSIWKMLNHTCGSFMKTGLPSSAQLSETTSDRYSEDSTNHFVMPMIYNKNKAQKWAFQQACMVCTFQR